MGGRTDGGKKRNAKPPKNPQVARYRDGDQILAVLDEGAKIPDRIFPGDAGYDLACNQDLDIPPNSFRDIPTGVYLQLPEGIWGMIVGRSSTLRRRGLLVAMGIIDNGYRGELFAGVWNLTRVTASILKGQRVAQLLLFSLVAPGIEAAEELDSSDRGEKGFGSTGQ